MNKQEFLAKVKSLEVGSEELKQIEMTIFSENDYSDFYAKFFGEEEDGMKVLQSQNLYKIRAKKLKEMLGDDDFNSLKSLFLDKQIEESEVIKLSDIVDAGCGFVIETSGNGSSDAVFVDDIVGYESIKMEKSGAAKLLDTSSGVFECEYVSDWVVDGDGDNPFKWRAWY